MDREQIKHIIDNPEEYDESREETLTAWLRDGHSKRMRWVMVNVYVGYTILTLPMIYCAWAFFRTDRTQSQILYAVLFLFCNAWIGFLSVFAWVMMQRPNISRQIKRLELHIAELTETLSGR